MKNIKLVFLFIYFLQLALYSQELYTPVTDTQGGSILAVVVFYKL